jgi:competence protein ComEC
MAMPVVTTLVMPFVFAALILIPMGFEAIALVPVSYGIEIIVWVSRYVEGLSPISVTGLLPASTALMFCLGFVLLVLCRTKLRLMGILPLLGLTYFYSQPDIPDVLIAENGRTIAAKSTAGELSLILPKRDNFVSTIWGKAYAGGSLPKLQKIKDACNKERCIHVLPQSLVLHIVYAPDLLASSCKRADILVAPRLKWVNCKARKPMLILKRGDFERKGSHAVYVSKTTNSDQAPQIIHEVTVALPENNRAWQRGAGIPNASDTDE